MKVHVLHTRQGKVRANAVFKLLTRLAHRAHVGEIEDVVVAIRTPSGWEVLAPEEEWGTICPSCFPRLMRRDRRDPEALSAGG